MKKLLFIFLIFNLFSCSKYQKLLKSDNFDLKYETAIGLYNQEKFSKSLILFENLLSEFKGSNKSEDVYYYYTYCLYNLGDYVNAAYHFNNFSKTFFSSKKLKNSDAVL